MILFFLAHMSAHFLAGEHKCLQLVNDVMSVSACITFVKEDTINNPDFEMNMFSE